MKPVSTPQTLVMDMLGVLLVHDYRIKTVMDAFDLATVLSPTVHTDLHEATTDFAVHALYGIAQDRLSFQSPAVQEAIARRASGPEFDDCITKLMEMQIHPVSAGVIGMAITMSHSSGQDVAAEIVRMIDEAHQFAVTEC